MASVNAPASGDEHEEKPQVHMQFSSTWILDEGVVNRWMVFQIIPTPGVPLPFDVP
jgi:hypothetical protein